MQTGTLDLQILSGGHLLIDGGSMFGVVPKVLWQRKFKPDERNRIFLETNCLLVHTEQELVLIGTGYGSKAEPRERENFSLQEGNPLLNNLAQHGIQPQDIDWIILTHLHFDHAGGCTIVDESGKCRPAFPRARYVVQRAEWEDATANKPELAGAYLPRDFLPIADTGQLHLIDGETQILPGISVRPTGGHTRGHQIVVLQSNERTAVCLGDLCPTSAHLRTFWTLAYDQFPLITRSIKPNVLGEIADRGWLAIFNHDPQIQAAVIARDPKEEFVVHEVVPL